MRSSAIFSLPGQDQWHYLSGEATFIPFDKIAEFSNGFYAVPFDTGTELVFIPGAAKNISLTELENTLQEMEEALPAFAEIKIPGHDHLLPLLGNAISALQKGDYEKLVIATCRKVTNVKINLAATLYQLRAELPHTFICLMYDAKYGTWLSASPELLLAKDGSAFTSFALAGTKKKAEDFSEKEQQEQKIVTRYIGDTLKKNCDASEIMMEDEVLSFGELKHLLTTIHFRSAKTAAEITRALHPTPAVCGMPKQAAMNFLLDHEEFDRGLYCGFWGYVQNNQLLRFYVNLRTLQLFRETMLSYAGAGITAQSNAEKESEEIGQKMNSMIKRVQTSAR